MELNRQDIAERFAALPHEKRKEFLGALRKRGFDFSLLPIVRQTGKNRRMLSYAQQRHWFLWQLEPLSTAYHLSGALHLTGKLDIEVLHSSIDALVMRHESLRTIFRANAEGMAEQIIEAERKLDIPLIDLCGLPSAQRATRAYEEADQVSATPFDLTRGPLFRVVLIRIAPEEHLLVVVMHHIVSDDWSNGIIIGEFAAQYRARVQGQAPSLPALPIQYADYAAWQRNWLEAGEKERQLAYWRGQLGEDHPVLQLPTDHPRPATASYRAARHSFVLPAALVAGLQRQAQRQGATLFMALLAGFQALLHRYTGQDDIRVGVPIANRHRIEVESIVGFFVNTQVLRNRIDSRASLKALLDQAREASLGAQTHQDLPFEQLVEALQPERNLNQNPLFQVMYNHLREDADVPEPLPGLTMENHILSGQAAQFELTLDTTERPDGQVSALLSYAAELFEAGTIERLGRHYLHLLWQLAEHPERRLGDIDFLSGEEKAQLWAWGVNEQRYGNAEPVHRLIERQAEANPGAVALVFGDTELSYSELNQRANRLAHRLIGLGVKAETKVGIAVERSVEMIVGLLAILKAGGAYVPLDPEYPRERLHYMVEDSGIGMLLTQSHVRGRIPHGAGCEVLALDTLEVEGESASDPRIPLHGDNLAYVIYTSGSTGKPKGVAITQGALSMHVQAIGEAYGMTPEDKELQFASINFDGAHERWLVPLAFGATLMPRDNDIWPVDRTAAEIARHRITIACFTPGYLHQLAELIGSAGRSLPIRSYTVGGEAMSRASFDFVQETLRPPRLINGYGPTETVITPLISKAYPETRFESPYMPIGCPVGDRNAYILDPGLNPVPQGVAGELYLGGMGLARGYLNRGGLTAERFIADPFDGKGGRLYRTGDLARWRADGQIEYLGRLDHQVKVRGFRIELGEIEAQLLLQPEVREAVVVAREGPSGARLVAYVSLHGGAGVDPATLREALGKALPDYMIPSAIVVMEGLPLNPNGKVDRKALPEPEFANVDHYEAPQGEAEEVLAGIWAEVLGIGQVGRHDNFFELGGDSILSLQIVTKARRAGWKITPRQLFERQTVAELGGVAVLAAAAKTAQANAEAPSADGTVPLLPIQIEFFEQEIPARHHWNQAVLFKSSQRLDIGCLAQALEAVARRHDALRFRYVRQPAGDWLQVCAEPSDRDLQYMPWVRQAASAGQFESFCNEAQRSLDLAEGPLLRALVIEMADGTQRLLLVIHHLVIDGVSWRILLEDLQSAYHQCRIGTPPVLAEKTTDYRVWAQRLQDYVRSHAEEPIYWQKLADVPVSLPKNRLQGPSSAAHQASIVLRLDRMQTQALLKQAPAAYRTHVNDLLLTALGGALCQWSGHDRILVDLEGHGREDLYADIDLSHTLGWFTSLYPVVLDSSGNLGERIKRTKETLRQIPNKGLGHGIFKYYGAAEQRQALARVPRPEVVFNYLGQFDASFEGETSWMLAAEPIGDLTDPATVPGHDISISGHVYEGEFSLEVSYSQDRYDKDNIESFVQGCRVELEKLIAHCASGIWGATPSDFPLLRITQAELDDLPVPAGRLDDLYPLSPMQSGMLFHSVYDSDGSLYVNQLRADIEGLEVGRFKAAWQAAVDRHDVLRTGFLHQRDMPLQWVAKTVELQLTEYDWRARPIPQPMSRAQELEALARSEHARGFDLAQPPLMRLSLVRLVNKKYHFIWTIHHLLLDGWSASQLMGEVLQQYGGARLPSSGGRRYRDYIGWLQARDMNASEAHWREQLHGMEEPTRLADIFPAHAENPGHEEYPSEMGRTATAGLIDFAKRERITVNTLVQAAWALLLNHYTGQPAVVFGVTVAGRPDDLPGADRLLGLFINTLPVVAKVDPARETTAWLRELQAQNLSLREHAHTPLYEIQRWGGQGGQGLFDSILVFENYPMDEALQQFASSELAFSAVQSREVTNYALTVSVTQTDALCLNYSYTGSGFSKANVSRLAAQMNRLLHEITRSSGRRLGDIDFLSGEEKAQLWAWGVNEQRYGNVEPVHRLIERQAEANPGAVALVFGDTELSYSELNQRANRLAHRLIGLGVKAETKVGIAVERSVEMIVGLLAILKAGGAYVPLDPEYPRERLHYMVEDSGIGMLLTQSHVRGRIPHGAGCEVLALDRLELDGESASDPRIPLHGDNLAYVIYTSGSTGKPKGVALPHHALAEHAQVAAGFFGLSAADRMLLFSTINFDGFIEQLFPPLCTGAAIVLRGPSLWDSETFYRELINKRITVADLTTAYWFLLVQDFARLGRQDYGLLRQVHAGGEAMSPEGIKAWHEAGLGDVTLLNTYGPTEATVTATALDCAGYASSDTAPMQVSIGKPLAGRSIHLLDANLTPVMPGVPGELCIGGELLARGYLNRGGLTAERFIADPFDGKGGRLYRTGDLARWRADGQIEYLGRLDHQVKVRGFRIELGEIEAQLLLQPEVREAVVVAREGPSGARLVAYVSLHGGAGVDHATLREALGKALPDYMIPSAIVVMEGLPLNPNGKVERKALPEPEFANVDHYEAPQGEAEEVLAGIWAEVLGIGQVGRHDNFFELGGDSILSLQIVTKARRAGWKITPRQLFERQTVAELGGVADADEPASASVAAAEPERGYLHDYLSGEMIAALPFGEDGVEDIYPLAPIQEGMLFHTLEAPGTGLYVTQLSVAVDGLEPERLAEAWRAMVARHPVLRTGFLWQAGLARPLQIVFRQADAPVIHLDWRGLEQMESRIAAYADEDLKREFDFLSPPVARLSLIRVSEDAYHLVWTKHHILLDGWGDSLLISDWLRCYAGETLAAPPGPDYGHYVRWLARQDAEATKAFWETELRHLDGATLLANALRTAGKTGGSDERTGYTQIYTHFDAEETGNLQAFVQRERVTLNTLVQAAWAQLLQRYTGKDRVVFGVTVAGRSPNLPRSDEILGLFINTIPVPVERRSDLTVSEHLSMLQSANARLREHEHTSLADIQRWAGSSGQSLFDSIVVFENYPIAETLRSNELYGLRFGDIEGKGLTGYAMDLQVVVGETLEIEYSYGQKDFTDEFVLELRSHMEFLMREMMSHPRRRLGELGWMGTKELNRLFSLGCNAHASGMPAHVSIPSRQQVHRLIEHNAAVQPDAIALLMGEQELSYAELNRRANQLAHRLIGMGAGLEVRIGVAMERSLDVIVVLLAVLKAGGAYVPLDPDYPADRLSFMTDDSAVALIITQGKLLPRLAGIAGVSMLALDLVELASEPDSNPEIEMNEHNLAYIIYTSGSTGTPKGVAVTHGPLAMHCRATAEIYGMGLHSNELLFMSFSFDGAHERWLTALTVGAGLAVRDQELWTAEQTYDALHHYGITNAAFPPAYLGQVAEWAAPRDDPPPVDLYVFGGEAMPKASYDLIRRTLRPRILINGYGPTETVVTPLIWKTEASNSFDCVYAPIGRPVGERTAYVLDVNMQPVPAGIAGELYIGGYGLARGYLGRAGLTAERFVSDPFDDDGGRLYRTGDLVRWLDDGNIEYLGRVDHQVKIRGFRIELGEIEACIREVTGVADAAVVVHAGATGDQLAAYVVPLMPGGDAQPRDLAAQLKRDLGKRLPEYMLPAHTVFLASLPRLPSGKLDRHALPEPGAAPAADAYRAPSTRQAILLAEIWREVLAVERVGETDNFFALGGDSLSSLKVMARMRNLTEVKFDFKLRDLMQRPTIAGLLGLDAPQDTQAPEGAQALMALNLPCEEKNCEALFCIHAGLGTVFDYQPLARQLQGKRMVYGLQCRMLADPAHRDASLDQMAADYCRMIRQIQPEGPYHLLGWSLGGTLAAMIAAFMEADAQTVAFLGLIDSFIPGTEQPQPDDWRSDFSDFVSVVIPGAKPGDATRHVFNNEEPAESGQPPEPAIANLLEQLIPAKQIRDAGEGDAGTGCYADVGAEELARTFAVARRLKALSLQAAGMSPLQVPATCWWAVTRPSSERRALALQIDQHRPHSIEIDADHFAIVRTASLLLGVESALAAVSAARVPKAEEVD